MTAELIIVLSAVAATYVLTGLVRRLALAHGVLDVPNDRSSHDVPTPRGGGIAIVITTVIALSLLASLRLLAFDRFMALAVGGVIIAVVGFLDDRQGLRASRRLMVHFSAALWALAWLGGLPPLQFGSQLFSFGWEGYLLGALGIVWTLNLFNFMDGIDGIAGSEAVFIAGGGALATSLAVAPGDVPAASLAFGAACGGFLLWNWPPAKIFMGDVGSGFIGYMVVVLALMAARDNPVALLVWLMLGGVFFIDATITLVRRVGRGERAHEAHRSHAYQWLARRWHSHRRVTVSVLAVNLCWLLPCALIATSYPHWAGWMTLAALVPVAACAVLAGAGRAEPRSDSERGTH
jgi:Fuc2NAc and GlcNAc transferase